MDPNDIFADISKIRESQVESLVQEESPVRRPRKRVKRVAITEISSSSESSSEDELFGVENI